MIIKNKTATAVLFKRRIVKKLTKNFFKKCLTNCSGYAIIITEKEKGRKK
jgi:hypothetical protein